MTRGSQSCKDLKAERQAKCTGLEVRKTRCVGGTARGLRKGECAPRGGQEPVTKDPSAQGEEYRFYSRRTGELSEG